MQPHVPSYQYDANSYERRIAEGRKRESRSDFQRDRDRIQFSRSFLRLSDVTQVWQADGLRQVRNRYAHSIEVANIAANIANRLGVDANLAAAASLAHDLGHPPFGHHGEEILNQLALEVGLDGYEGNAQTLRVLGKLEQWVHENEKSYGINPTRALADAATKYPWHRDEFDIPKFGYYRDDPDDVEFFEWIRQDSPVYEKCVEAQLMDWADDVAYSTHDIEDGITSGLIDVRTWWDEAERRELCAAAASRNPELNTTELDAAYGAILELPELLALKKIGTRLQPQVPALLKRLTGALIDQFVDSVVRATWQAANERPIGRYDGQLVVPERVRAEAEVLKAITWRYVIESHRFQVQRGREKEMLYQLSCQLLAANSNTDKSVNQAIEAIVRQVENLSFILLWDSAKTIRDNGQRTRCVFDAVASLTDQGVIALARRVGGVR